MATSLVLPARGKAAKLVDERALPGHLKCSSCQQPVYNSFQTPHGCRLCQTCVDGLPPQEKVPCPGKTDACRDEEEEEDTNISQASCFPDMASRREIGKLKVSCPNRAEGCGAQFQWRDVETHLSSCDFEKVQCDLCGEPKLKRDLPVHKDKECRQRTVRCKECQTMVAAGVLDSEHRNLQSSACCLTWKITDVAARQTEMRKKLGVKCLYSPPFAVGPFKFRAYIYLNGFGLYKGSHLAIYLALVHGPSPDSTKWPFRGQVTFDLVRPGGFDGRAGCPVVVRINTRHRRPAGAGDLSLHWGELRFLPLRMLRKWVHSDGCLEITVLVEEIRH